MIVFVTENILSKLISPFHFFNVVTRKNLNLFLSDITGLDIQISQSPNYGCLYWEGAQKILLDF